MCSLILSIAHTIHIRSYLKYPSKHFDAIRVKVLLPRRHSFLFRPIPRDVIRQEPRARLNLPAITDIENHLATDRISSERHFGNIVELPIAAVRKNIGL